MTTSLRLLSPWLALLASLTAQAQDPQFSQFYANPVYQNPAFAGQMGMSRVGITVRDQWPNLSTDYKSVSAFADTYVQPDGWNVGFGGGLLLGYHRQGQQFSSTWIALPLSASFRLSSYEGSESRFTLGVQPGWLSQRLGTDGLTFVDQYGVGGLVNGPSRDPLALSGLIRNKFDLTLGVLFEQTPGDGNPSWWAGFAMHHFGNQIKQQSWQSDWIDQHNSLQAGVAIPLPGLELWSTHTTIEQDRTKQLSFTANYRQQGPNQQLDVGLNFTYSPIMLGLWYRGIPLKGNPGLNPDALIGIVGWQQGRFMVEYSYDFTVSSLTNTPTGGSHEISLWFGLDDNLFRYRGKGYRSARRQRECFQY